MSAYRSPAWTTADEAAVAVGIWRNRAIALQMLYRDGTLSADEALRRAAEVAEGARLALSRLVEENGGAGKENMPPNS